MSSLNIDRIKRNHNILVKDRTNIKNLYLDLSLRPTLTRYFVHRAVPTDSIMPNSTNLASSLCAAFAPILKYSETCGERNLRLFLNKNHNISIIFCQLCIDLFVNRNDFFTRVNVTPISRLYFQR